MSLSNKRTLPPAWKALFTPKKKHESSSSFCLACIIGGAYHHGHFKGCPCGRKKGEFTPRDLAGQRNAARRYLQERRHSNQLDDIKQMKWYPDLIALAEAATSNRGLGPECELCKLKTTLRVTNNRGHHFGRKYFKCMPCDKFSKWAGPIPEIQDLGLERADEEALAEAEAAEAVEAAAHQDDDADDVVVDLTTDPAFVDLTQE